VYPGCRRRWHLTGEADSVPLRHASKKASYADPYNVEDDVRGYCRVCSLAGSRPRGQRRPRCPDRPNHLCSLPCRRPRTVCRAEQPSAAVSHDREYARDDEHRPDCGFDDIASIDAQHCLGARRTARRDRLYFESEVMVPMKTIYAGPLVSASCHPSCCKFRYCRRRGQRRAASGAVVLGVPCRNEHSATGQC
jgi:hypothetical protein